MRRPRGLTLRQRRTPSVRRPVHHLDAAAPRDTALILAARLTQMYMRRHLCSSPLLIMARRSTAAHLLALPAPLDRLVPINTTMDLASLLSTIINHRIMVLH